jgi:hypothetical protein
MTQRDLKQDVRTAMNELGKSIDGGNDETIDTKIRAVSEARRTANGSWLRKVSFATIVMLFLACVSAVWFAYGLRPRGRGWSGWSPTRTGAMWGIVIVVIIMFGLTLWRFQEGGLFGFAKGADGRLSTSRFQAGMWTVVVAFAFLYFTIQLRFAAGQMADAFNRIFRGFDAGYLILLGGPFAAFAIARSVTSVKIQAGDLQKVQADEAQIRDLFANDHGSPSLTDTQFRKHSPGARRVMVRAAWGDGR